MVISSQAALVIPAQVPVSMKKADPVTDAAFCVQYRQNLTLHTQLSGQDRHDAGNLGIAAVALSWIPLIPGTALGIAAVVLGARCDTPVRQQMILAGVNDSNWRWLNERCANVLSRNMLRETDGITFVGARVDAVKLGIAAIGLSALSAIAFALFFTFFEFSCCCCEIEEVEDEYSGHYRERTDIFFAER